MSSCMTNPPGSSSEDTTIIGLVAADVQQTLAPFVSGLIESMLAKHSTMDVARVRAGIVAGMVAVSMGAAIELGQSGESANGG